jgi:hypothetical protein
MARFNMAEDYGITYYLSADDETTYSDWELDVIAYDQQEGY